MNSILLDARTATDHFPGIGRYVVNLARALKQVAPERDLTLLRDPSASSRLALPDLPTIDCPASPFSLQQQWHVRQIVRKTCAALYHSPYYLMPYRLAVPTVFTCHDLIPLIYPRYFSAAQRLIYRFTHRLALNTAQVTIVVSQSTKNDVRRFFHVNPDRLVVIPEGVDEHFKPSSRAEIDQVRQKYALPDRYMLYFGSNKPHKNLLRLVEAFVRSNFQTPTSNIHLVIAGHWDARYPEAKQLVEKLNLPDHVRFIGQIDDIDLPALYSGAELFVLPSEYEGFGLPVLEAMACDTPVLCSSTSSLPEVVGECGVMFDPTNVDAIAESIERALADRALREHLREQGHRRAAQFTWQRTADQTWQVYRTMTSGA